MNRYVADRTGENICITFKKSICEKVRGLYVIPGINIKAAIFIFKTISRKQAFFTLYPELYWMELQKE